MPFDSKDFVETPDVTTPPGLIAWLESRDLREEYDIKSNTQCLWGRALGRRVFVQHMPDFKNGGWGWKIALARPHTMGAALERARKLLAAS